MLLVLYASDDGETKQEQPRAVGGKKQTKSRGLFTGKGLLDM